jgi:hypothetical protein
MGETPQPPEGGWTKETLPRDKEKVAALIAGILDRHPLRPEVREKIAALPPTWLLALNDTVALAEEGGTVLPHIRVGDSWRPLHEVGAAALPPDGRYEPIQYPSGSTPLAIGQEYPHGQENQL